MLTCLPNSPDLSPIEQESAAGNHSTPLLKTMLQQVRAVQVEKRGPTYIIREVVFVLANERMLNSVKA